MSNPLFDPNADLRQAAIDGIRMGDQKYERCVRYPVQDEEVQWEYGNFDGFDNQKRCPRCGHTVHSHNDGSHQCEK